MEIQLQIIGMLLMVLASLHVFFPRYFNWKEELKPLSLINQQMMKVHTFFIALVVFLMGVLCVVATTDLMQTRLGKILCVGLGFFWGTRLLFQLLVYSPKLWKGKQFETRIHVVFTLFWTYLTTVFFWVGLG